MFLVYICKLNANSYASKYDGYIIGLLMETPKIYWVSVNTHVISMHNSDLAMKSLTRSEYFEGAYSQVHQDTLTV